MSQEGRKILANKIQKYRLEVGLNKEQLSFLLNKDNSYISKLEKLKINISIDMLEKISKALNKKIDDFLNTNPWFGLLILFLFVANL